MNVGKTVAIILLTLFVFVMPLAAFASNFGAFIYSQEKVQDILVNSAFSDEALPYRLKELVMTQAKSGNWGPGVDPGTLNTALESIDNQQWVVLFDTVMPENTRLEMVEGIAGGIFFWLDSADVYPSLTLSFGPLFSNLETHDDEIINWAVTAFDGPPCTEERNAQFAAGEYGDDLLTLVSCQPPDDARDGVTAHAASLLPSADAVGSSSGEINLTETLKNSVGEEMIATLKMLARRMRLVLPLLWTVPVLLFVVAMALTVSTLKDAAIWARWPLIAAGALGIVLALLIMNPAGLLDQALPASGNISALAAVLITSLLVGLAVQVGRAMLWQMGLLLVIGAVLLVFSYVSKDKKADVGEVKTKDLETTLLAADSAESDETLRSQ